MSLENASSHGESTYKKKNFPVLQELDDEPDCLSVIVNDQDGNQLQGIILEAHELLGTTLTAVTLPDGTHAFLTNQGQNLELDGKDGDEDVHRSILIRDVSGVEGKVVHLKVDPVAVQSQLGTSKSSETYTQIQIINGTAYMITSRPDTGSVKSKKNDKTIFVKETETRSKYSCPREGCNKVYTTPHHLKVHERSHTGLRPYECGFSKCNKSFSTGYSLKAHLRTHTGEKPYKCTTSTCEKSFKTSGDLLKHIRTHTGERPFLCPFEACGRSFTTSNIRKVHIRTHTGERPYKCRLCNKAFASATNYKNHVRIHSQEKPYTCGVENCGKAFTEYSSLYKHRLVHTQAKPFECNFCLKSYRQGSTLVMHKRTAHALIESDEGMDVYSETEKSGEQHNLQKRRAKQNKIIISETGPLDISEATEDSSDNETQIFLVGDPKQLVTLQQMGLEENFDDSIMDTSLEGLNIKIEGMEFAWN